jgi:alpha-maltose-1-phosphate synthase
MPQAGLGGDLALRHALEVDTYDMYCGHTCSLVAVDVQAAAAAFERLFNSPELRRQMGEAGRARAQALYDWKPIIGQYEALWGNLSELRAAQAKDLQALAHPWPARMDPFHAFASYPTQSLTPQTVLGLVDADLNTAVDRALAYRQLAMVDFARNILPTEAEVRAVLAAAQSPAAASALVQGIAQARQPFVFRALAWLLKLGVLKVLS